MPLALAAGLSSNAASAATISYFNSDLDFVNSLYNVTATENFNDGVINAPISVTSDEDSIVTGTPATNKLFADRINNDLPPTVWTFASAINGFGGLFDLAGPGGEGTGIAVTLGLVGGGTQSLAVIPNTLNGSFWGFISSVAFTTVTFTEGNLPGNFETYTLDNLTVGELAPVPVPASFGLLALGLGGIAALKRRRRA
jgi:hypothetical protein